MNAEIEGYFDQLLSVRQDALGLMSGLSDSRFNWQPTRARWSMARCFDHINQSAAGSFIPAIYGALATAQAGGLRHDGPFQYPAWQHWLIRRADRPSQSRRLIGWERPHSRPSLAIAVVRADFTWWQDELARCLGEADGYDLQRATQPFCWPLRWSLGALFQRMLAHERRHVREAREVRRQPDFGD